MCAFKFDYMAYRGSGTHSSHALGCVAARLLLFPISVKALKAGHHKGVVVALLGDPRCPVPAAREPAINAASAIVSATVEAVLEVIAQNLRNEEEEESGENCVEAADTRCHIRLKKVSYLRMKRTHLLLKPFDARELFFNVRSDFIVRAELFQTVNEVNNGLQDPWNLRVFVNENQCVWNIPVS